MRIEFKYKDIIYLMRIFTVFMRDKECYNKKIYLDFEFGENGEIYTIEKVEDDNVQS